MRIMQLSSMPEEMKVAYTRIAVFDSARSEKSGYHMARANLRIHPCEQARCLQCNLHGEQTEDNDSALTCPITTAVALAVVL